MSEIVLYDAAGVPSPRRVRMVLIEKRVPFRIKWLNVALMDQKQPWYLKLNPTGLVPTLLDGEHVLFESNVINEYLEARFPDPRLVPTDPWGQAQMRMWFAFEGDWSKPFRDVVYETMAKERLKGAGLSVEQLRAEIAKRTPNEAYAGIAARVLTAPRDDTLVDEKKKLLFEKIACMEDRLGDGRPWLCGEEFSLADIALTPRLEMFPAIGVDDLYRRYPRIGAFMARAKARPSWDRSAIRPEPGETERTVEPEGRA
ncbi:MAG: glutathione S-transferase family protein [Burkholderiaceae bacterium]